jgi:hypothetical protein
MKHILLDLTAFVACSAFLSALYLWIGEVATLPGA